MTATHKLIFISSFIWLMHWAALALFSPWFNHLNKDNDPY